MRVSLCLFITFTLLSCGGTQGRFRLKGEFQNLRQGEFYIYSPDGGTQGFDTIKLEGGQFDYETELADSAIYYLLYPNHSEQVIFGSSGDLVTITGDARALREAEVKGSVANDQFTAFRLENLKKSAAEVTQAAGSFIRRMPGSAVSVYLFKYYFLQPEGVSRKKIREYYNLLCQAQPENLTLLQWKDDVERRCRRVEADKAMTDFSIVKEEGDTLRLSDYKGKYLLVNFWASWEGTGTSAMYRLRKLRREYPGKLDMLSISLDVNRNYKNRIGIADSTDWIHYCDFQAWNSPAVRQFEVPVIPYYILVGPDGKVIAVGADLDESITPKLDKLFKKE